MGKKIKGIWLPMNIVEKKEINFLEKIILAKIISLSKKNGCVASNEYFANFFGLSKGRISQIISKLKKLGFLEEISFDGKVRILQQKIILHKSLEKKENVDKTDLSDFVDWWNATFPQLPNIIFLSETRKKLLQERIVDTGSVDNFKTILEKAIYNSDFLQGKNKEGWRCSFDFVIKKTNFIKIYENSYQNSSFSGTKNKINNFINKTKKY